MAVLIIHKMMEVPPETPLLRVLRDILNLKGTNPDYS
jgi:aerobic-type carbon monoxide dehydrogenase small subunit (CoxS/CutS family)